MKLFKLTEQDFTTYNKSMSWKLNETNSVSKKENPKLCYSDVIHAYKNKNLGLLLNPIHAVISNPIIFECEGKVVVKDWNKVGVFRLTPKKKLQQPKWYKNEETRKKVQQQFAILCAEKVLHIFEEKYPDDSRPRKSIEAAKNYLENPTEENKKFAYAAATAAAAYAAASYAYAAYAAAAATAYAAYAAASYAATAYAAATAATAAAAAAAVANADTAAANAAAYAAAANTASYAAAAADNAYAAYAATAVALKINFSKLADLAVKRIMDKK